MRFLTAGIMFVSCLSRLGAASLDCAWVSSPHVQVVQPEGRTEHLLDDLEMPVQVRPGPARPCSA